MLPSELDKVLMFAEELDSDLTTVMTVNARHTCALEIAEDYTEVAAQHGNGGLCFVAGNPSYLTEEERGLDAKSRVSDLVRFSRRELSSAPIFVGTEGLREWALELCKEYSTIPFMLLGGAVEDHASKIRLKGIHDGVGVYCPCDLSNKTDQELIESFGHYALRRKWVRRELEKRGLNSSVVKTQLSNGHILEKAAVGGLADAIRKLALCDVDQAKERLWKFADSGVSYIALLLDEESFEENHRASRLAEQFR